MGTTLLDEQQPTRGGTTDLDSHRAKGTTVMSGSGGGTRLVGPEEANASRAVRSDPVVGWLVVVKGPGKGSALELGYGMNSIGRSGANRVVLDFGDDQISADDHFRVAYDGESREFHLIPAKGTNLLYVDNKSLLSPAVLNNFADIRVGGTVLRFVALCSPAWDWADTAPSAP